MTCRQQWNKKLLRGPESLISQKLFSSSVSSPNFVELDSSLPCSQKPTIGHYFDTTLHCDIHKSLPLVTILTPLYTVTYTKLYHWSLFWHHSTLWHTQKLTIDHYIDTTLHCDIHKTLPLVTILTPLYTVTYTKAYHWSLFWHHSTIWQTKVYHWSLFWPHSTLWYTQKSTIGHYFDPTLHCDIHKSLPLVTILTPLNTVTYTKVYHWSLFWHHSTLRHTIL